MKFEIKIGALILTAMMGLPLVANAAVNESVKKKVKKVQTLEEYCQQQYILQTDAADRLLEVTVDLLDQRKEACITDCLYTTNSDDEYGQCTEQCRSDFENDDTAIRFLVEQMRIRAFNDRNECLGIGREYLS